MDRRTLPALAGMLLAALLAGGGALLGSAPMALAGAAAAAASAVLIVVVRAGARAKDRRKTATAPAVVDVDTGLPDNSFFEVLLEGRVATARRRLWPLALVMIEIQPVAAVGLFTVLLRRTIREADTACRIGPTTFAVLLEDTGDTGGVWAAERIQIAAAKERDAAPAGTELRVAAGVAAYPNHALKADQLLVAAESALERARGHCPPDRGLGAVEVARADLR